MKGRMVCGKRGLFLILGLVLALAACSGSKGDDQNSANEEELSRRRPVVLDSWNQESSQQAGGSNESEVNEAFEQEDAVDAEESEQLAQQEMLRTLSVVDYASNAAAEQSSQQGTSSAKTTSDTPNTFAHSTEIDFEAECPGGGSIALVGEGSAIGGNGELDVLISGLLTYEQCVTGISEFDPYNGQLSCNRTASHTKTDSEIQTVWHGAMASSLCEIKLENLTSDVLISWDGSASSGVLNGKAELTCIDQNTEFTYWCEFNDVLFSDLAQFMEDECHFKYVISR